jgi:D-alanyl-D-alanine carboxypeptidase (penicillin-binding protein 5/6)
MQIPLLREIAAERQFQGNSLGDIYIEGARTVEHNWIDTNELISGGAFHFPYATGIRSGTTAQASDNVAASAERRGVRLIAVVLNSADPGRWQDARTLFEYGFATYEYHTILTAGQYIYTAGIYNYRRGEEDTLEIVAADGFYMLLSPSELARLERIIEFDELFIAPEIELEYYEEPAEAPTEPTILNTSLLAPIEAAEPLGTLTYTLDGTVIFTTQLLSTATILERTVESDMDYFILMVQENIFSMQALPWWLGGAGLLIGIIGIFIAINERRKSRRSFFD